jgi:hypothetical protein
MHHLLQFGDGGVVLLRGDVTVAARLAQAKQECIDGPSPAVASRAMATQHSKLLHVETPTVVASLKPGRQRAHARGSPIIPRDRGRSLARNHVRAWLVHVGLPNRHVAVTAKERKHQQP